MMWEWGDEDEQWGWRGGVGKREWEGERVRERMREDELESAERDG
jgi:hypothetical protein